MKRFEDNAVAYDLIDVQGMPVSEEVIQSIDSQIVSVEDINELLFKIGVCFVGNRQ
jgi:hypothetical protein